MKQRYFALFIVNKVFFKITNIALSVKIAKGTPIPGVNKSLGCMVSGSYSKPGMSTSSARPASSLHTPRAYLAQRMGPDSACSRCSYLPTAEDR